MMGFFHGVTPLPFNPLTPKSAKFNKKKISFIL